MPYITSVERIGYKRGIQQGKSILASLIAKKFKTQADQEMSRLEKLKPDDLPELGEQLLDFESSEAVHHWIEQRTVSLGILPVKVKNKIRTRFLFFFISALSGNISETGLLRSHFVRAD